MSSMKIQLERTARKLKINNYSRKTIKSYIYRLNDVYPAYFLLLQAILGLYFRNFNSLSLIMVF